MAPNLNYGKRLAWSDCKRITWWLSWWFCGSLAMILLWCWWLSTAPTATAASRQQVSLPRMAMPGDHFRLGPERTSICTRSMGAPVRTILAVNEGPGSVRMWWQRGDVISTIRLAAGAKQAVRGAGLTIALEEGRSTALIRVNVLQERPGMRGGAR